MPKLGLIRPVGSEHMGYGTFGYNLSKGLQELGIDFWENPNLSNLDPPRGIGSVIYTATPGWCPGRYRGQHITLFSMWEASHLPESFADRLHNYDQILVPNDTNLEQFKEYNSNVHKVHLGYDSTIWNYQPRQERESFRILFCGAGAVETTRKGSDVAITAFQEAFPNWKKMHPQPRLVVKCLDCPPKQQPEFMELHVGTWPVEELKALYLSCHGAIAPSRGEGWGYFPMQALASGIPTLISDIQGHREFLHLPGFLQISTQPKPALEFVYGFAGDWGEPSIDDTVQQFQRLYDDYRTLSREAKIGSEILELFWDHRAMARDVIKVIPETDPPGRKFEKFTNLEFILVTNRNLGPDECSVAGTRYNFQAGKEYWVPSGVCQVLERSGYRANLNDKRYRVPGVATS